MAAEQITETNRAQERESRRGHLDEDGQNDRGRSDAPRAASALQTHRQKAEESFTRTMKQQTAKSGDVVRIIECRPLSRLKRWTLGEVLRRAVQVARGSSRGRRNRPTPASRKTLKTKRRNSSRIVARCQCGSLKGF